MAGFRLSTTRSSSWRQGLKRYERAANEVKNRQWLAVKKAALFAEAELKKGLVRGKPGGKSLDPLSTTTRLLKGSSKPLLDRGDLLGSITTKFDKRAQTAFVGVLRSARSGDGESLVNIAAVHEFGTGPFVIPVTEGVRRFFWALHFLSGGAILPLAATTTEIMHPGVPARPFIRPTMEKIAPKLQQIIESSITQNGGPF